MIRQRFFSLPAALVLACYLFCHSAVLAAGSTPAFWQVRNGESVVFLMGSMHFGHPDFYPFPEVIEKAFEQSERLVVEVNLLNLSPQAAQIVFKHGGLPAGASLDKVISPAAYKALEAHAEKVAVPVSAFHRFQPWYVTLLLVEAEIRKTELQQQLGVDLYFLKRAGDKKIDELESLESQLGLFSGFPFPTQEKFLLQTLADLQNSRAYLMEMARAWKDGDIDALNKTLIEPFRTQEDAKELFNKLFTQRNLEMAEAVERYLHRGGKTFFVVGAGHMLGEEGLVSLLERKGLPVKRVMLVTE